MSDTPHVEQQLAGVAPRGVAFGPASRVGEPSGGVFLPAPPIGPAPATPTPHFAFPFVRDGDHVAVNEQDTSDEIIACVEVIATTPLGFRQDRPDFGWRFPTFRTIPLSTAGLEEAIRRFEPRADFTASEFADLANVTYRHMEIDIEEQS